MVKGARLLKVGDISTTEARIFFVTNANEGKIVKVKGHVCRDGEPVIAVVSAFLYRSRCSDYHKTFETMEDPDYLIEIADDAAVGLLQSKEWFQWHHDDKPLLREKSFIFQISFQMSFLSAMFSSVMNSSIKFIPPR